MQTKISHKKFFHETYFPMKRKQGLAPQEKRPQITLRTPHIF